MGFRGPQALNDNLENVGTVLIKGPMTSEELAQRVEFSGWPGKVWANRLMQNNVAKHNKELEEVKSKFEAVAGKRPQIALK
jgi:hypothetical protein